MNKHSFCCNEMDFHIKNNEIHFHYYEDVRAYAVDYLEEAGGGSQAINYCPWCGNRLPKSLFQEKAKAIQETLGQKLTCFNESSLSNEFKTDEWWKRRGL